MRLPHPSGLQSFLNDKILSFEMFLYGHLSFFSSYFQDALSFQQFMIGLGFDVFGFTQLT